MNNENVQNPPQNPSLPTNPSFLFEGTMIFLQFFQRFFRHPFSPPERHLAMLAVPSLRSAAKWCLASSSASSVAALRTCPISGEAADLGGATSWRCSRVCRFITWNKPKKIGETRNITNKFVTCQSWGARFSHVTKTVLMVDPVTSPNKPPSNLQDSLLEDLPTTSQGRATNPGAPYLKKERTFHVVRIPPSWYPTRMSCWNLVTIRSS